MNDNDKKALLGNLIKKEREKAGLTQDKLSYLVGIDPTNLSKIERGISFPSFKNFCKFAEVLKIEPNYLLSFINFEKQAKNKLDKELYANIELLPDVIKIKILELIQAFNK